MDFFDTSDAYPIGGDLTTIGRTEEIIGRWLKGRREKIVVATKCFNPTGTAPNQRGLSRKHIYEAIGGRLRRLQTDYIDLYQVHFPDPGTPIDETMRALDDLVRQGKVRYLGCSNYAAWMLANALMSSERAGLSRFDCVQPRYNLLFRDRKRTAAAMPLSRHWRDSLQSAGGRIPQRKIQTQHSHPKTLGLDFSQASRRIYHGRYWHEAQFEAVTQLREFFTQRGKSLVQAAIASGCSRNLM